MSAALLFSLLFTAAEPQGVVIERATISWSELERLLKREGASAPKAPSQAPLAHSISNLEVSGEINGVRANIRCKFEIEILAKNWVIVPILPGNFALASGKVEADAGLRGILVRDANGVALVAKGEGNYHVETELEGELEMKKGKLELTIAPPGLTGGSAKLLVHGRAIKASGRTRWRASAESDARTLLEAALGAEGLELAFPAPKDLAPPEDAGGGLEDLRAITVVSLGGRGVTRISVLARPGASRTFEAVLPESAKLFKAWIGREGIEAEKVQRGSTVKIPLEHTARIELAYTFEASRLGVRGAWHVELPKLALEAQSAAWDVWLPKGLDYQDTQSSMIVSSACTLGQEPGLTKIDSVGLCFGFSRPVLEPGVPYAEGAYRQRF